VSRRRDYEIAVRAYERTSFWAALDLVARSLSGGVAFSLSA